MVEQDQAFVTKHSVSNNIPTTELEKRQADRHSGSLIINITHLGGHSLCGFHELPYGKRQPRGLRYVVISSVLLGGACPCAEAVWTHLW